MIRHVQRVRRRRSRRGSLVVEMLIMTPLFATLCGFAFWFFQVHTANQSVYRKVREPVWATATLGCSGGGQGGAAVSSEIPPIPPEADVWQVLFLVPGGPNNDAIYRPAETASDRAHEHIDGKNVPGIMRTPNARFRTSASMLCNEEVEDGELDTMKRLAAIAFQKSGGNSSGSSSGGTDSAGGAGAGGAIVSGGGGTFNGNGATGSWDEGGTGGGSGGATGSWDEPPETMRQVLERLARAQSERALTDIELDLIREIKNSPSVTKGLGIKWERYVRWTRTYKMKLGPVEVGVKATEKVGAGWGNRTGVYGQSQTSGEVFGAGNVRIYGVPTKVGVAGGTRAINRRSDKEGAVVMQRDDYAAVQADVEIPKTGKIGGQIRNGTQSGVEATVRAEGPPTTINGVEVVHGIEAGLQMPVPTYNAREREFADRILDRERENESFRRVGRPVKRDPLEP